MDRTSLVTAAKFASIIFALLALASPGATQAIGAMMASPSDDPLSLIDV